MHGEETAGKMNWGKTNEWELRFNAPKSRRRLLWRNHDSLYVAFGHFRMRLMKPRFML